MFSPSVVFTVFVALALQRARAHGGEGSPHQLSPEWQNHFQVKAPLPNVTFPLGRNWAGNIPVGRPNQPNDTLFFWAFEKEHGSFTADSTEPWGIFLNGGPGFSTLNGLLFENGPLHIASDYSVYANNYSWDRLADYIWIDQPVGVGYSTAGRDGSVADEDQVGVDFLSFLSNLVKVFPNLKTRPLYLTGESYAGMYIPYIAKAYFGHDDPPVKLRKIALGDPTLGDVIEFENLPTVSVIETFPQIIGYDTEVYEYFRTQSHLCGYDLNLTYPQTGKFPTITAKVEYNFSFSFEGGANTHGRAIKSKVFKNALREGVFRIPRHGELATRTRDDSVRSVKRMAKRDAWKRDISGRPNGSVDPFYGCYIWFEMQDYAINYTVPWKGRSYDDFDVDNLSDALLPLARTDASVFLNDNRTRAAIHAPTSKEWVSQITYNFTGGIGGVDPSVVPATFMDELAANATKHGVGIVIYSGNFDPLVPHLGSQVIIQNTTFGGIQGFSRSPSTPWFDDNGEFAGIVHQERNWTYVLIQGAGHLVPEQQPEKAFVVLREFILGSNTTGLVTSTRNTSGTPIVIGGENATLADTILPVPPGIFVGSGATQSTFVYPSETIAAWDRFFATARGGGITTTTTTTTMSEAVATATSAV